ncbi:MAG: diguanylate cyclase [Sulfuricella sp.]|nr:diguanylate cyclase [Sulfuricella sp.]
MVRKHLGVYFGLFGAWLFLASFVTASSIASDLRSAKLRFIEYASSLYGEIDNRVQTNETVLEGITAFLGASGTMNDGAQISRYAQQVRARHPHIAQIEVVESVARQNLPRFIAKKRASGLPEFQVRSFSHDSDRLWRSIDDKPWYYPIVFMEPMPTESRDILGLDMDSVPFLRLAMSASARQGHAVATHPFRLVEGDSAYVMFRPVAPLRIAGARAGDEKRLFASLVIKTQAILPSLRADIPGLCFSLYHADFPAHKPEGELIHFERHGRSDLETFLFPKLRYERKLEAESQPFILLAEQQLGWTALDFRQLTAILVITTLLFGVLLRFVLAHRRSELERCQTESRFAYLATHDALTGLANRTLFMDRLAHAMARAHRYNGKLALLFLDLDKFKQVNDTYGHGAGDQLLKMVAERICGCVREDDTVARLSGDEFVVVLESIATHQNAETVTEAIKNNLAQPFPIDDEIALHVGVSIGVAIYPDDSKDIDELIKCADHAMYEAKGEASKSPVSLPDAALQR